MSYNQSSRSGRYLAQYTTFELENLLAEQSIVILLPVGSVEPHGPHLELQTDTLISISAAEAAVNKLKDNHVKALIAPEIPYGVTNCASKFKGAITVQADALTAFLSSVLKGFISNGFIHCCVINNHLEPEQDQAIRNAVAQFDEHQTSIASPLTRRWARTLTDEYKKGECHAGQYETSIILADSSEAVRENLLESLEYVPVSLSEQLMNGVSDFKDMGMEQAYAGDPANASVSEGEQTIDKLAEMICTEVLESVSIG